MDAIHIPENKYVEMALQTNELQLNAYFAEAMKRGSALWGKCAVPMAEVYAGKYYFIYKVMSDPLTAVASPSGWLYIVFHNHRNDKDVSMVVHTQRFFDGRCGLDYDIEHKNIDDVLEAEGFSADSVDEFVRRLAIRYLRIVDWINWEMLAEVKKIERVKSEKSPVSSDSNKKTKPKKAQKRVVKVGAVKYVHMLDDTPESSAAKRTIERHCEAWRVRGHIRHLKSGKQVFVKPYIKGDKSKIADKDYVIPEK